MNNKNLINDVKVTQVKSSIGRKYDQKLTLIGLGLNKINKSVVLKNTDSVQGMLKKVEHLLKIENV
ncbi:50S ribosomal protein L30 [Rickettsia sp. MEAM1 (Bemisia tabaci)]|uniref:Large ribosomal subunit protein uL30 n=4 Tax=Rickettsia bellii TaxID=33990 RepID=RL30_RICBR|nr:MULTISPECIES: 50S ribosomal protein L30 [Rickettsia]A8GVD2.1 RecName: Full=Large ribosomal subunit protein uL30; AltName: Full=50S ribosomal protein L30 [Rickettsia bellii OSU 85-389]Q1RHN9.1 RecName: Full=Large ribosomal subunit protein uL30; AltName: Full=50S ribosomal protein L30 [Rickettsia bellii RML369-C]MCC8376857.1 50S ribosomal protein L30 [Rickettsia endosymbiont of Graphium doson]ABE05125.1 50S ribosomal protein L30 [Rickettsia bellii RML369-C]ABV78809.1 50S ribosomal protein L30